MTPETLQSARNLRNSVRNGRRKQNGWGWLKRLRLRSYLDVRPSWGWVEQLPALCGIVQRETCGPRRFGIIDDTLAPRCSAKAPGAAVRFDHAKKTNRPPFLLCQAF